MSGKKMAEMALQRRLARIEAEIHDRHTAYVRAAREHGIALAFFLELLLLLGAFMARRVIAA